MKKDRDELDDLFRSKLYDYETDVLPEDWEAIANRLPRPSVSGARRSWYYWAAAAVAALLVVVSGVYYISKEEPKTEYVAEKLKQQVEQAPVLPEVKPEKTLPVIAQTAPVPQIQPVTEWQLDEMEDPELKPAELNMKTTEKKAEPKSDVAPRQPRMLQRTTDSEPGQVPVTEKPKRKWSFGMGAGSLSAGNSSSVGSYALRSSSVLTNDALALMNAVNAFEAPETEIHHKMPFSVGLSVSRYLTDRWSLQTGLSYSLLVSNWKTNTEYWGECKQHLHFWGIPLAVSYKIAEWKRLQFYASAGGKVELNVAGKLRTELNSQEENMISFSEKQRVKEPYFSINGRVGVSYPIIRFVSAYAELGADYYFDNGSDIETYYTEKPFRFGLQIGFRFGL